MVVKEGVSPYARGFTARSCLAALSGIAACAFMTPFMESIDGSAVGIGAQAIPIPALFVAIPLLMLSAVFYALTRYRVLTRAELFVVLFAMFLATPLVSSGFWSMMIGAIGTIPKTADFETYDAWPKKLWPHGGNLLQDALAYERRDQLAVQGNVTWQDLRRERAGSARLPVLENAGESDAASIRMSLPVEKNAAAERLVIGEPYLFTVLLRPDGLSPAAYYYGHIYYDDNRHFATEAFSSRASGKVDYLHPEGFTRKGIYGLTVSAAARERVTIEIGLSGAGRLAIADVELLSVGALDAIYRGRKVITQSRFEVSGEDERQGLLVRPDNMWSVAGLKYIVAGYIPWRDWMTPFIAWTSFGFLCLAGAFSLAVLMRRQWIENERYPLPLTRIPLSLFDLGSRSQVQLGNEPDSETLPEIWRNRTMWMGFALALFWCLLKGWHFFNSNVPDMNIEVQLTPYFPDPMWGRMWYGEEVRNVTFAVSALLLSVAVFMELNVLSSLVLGFFLFRCQYWFGEATGLALKKDFPFPEQQQIGAYITYALLILFFTRKHIWSLLKAAFSSGTRDYREEALSPRGGLALLAACIAGIGVWSMWVGVAPRGMLVFFASLMMIALVATRVRAECGVLMSSFTPVNMAQILPIAGGMLFFGPAGVLFVAFANWIIFRPVFFLVPGMQLELLEAGRRFRLPPRHVLFTAILGVAGGLVLGGWAFLSLGYSIGGDNYGERWPYMDKGFIVNDFHTEMAKANTITFQSASQAGEAASAGGPMWGYAFAAAVTAALALLRQAFSGFWFHPVGFIVSSTPMMEYVWGSALAALVIRAITLKLGGAAVVRNRLMPFFIGVFLASVATQALFAALNAYLYFFHPTVMRETLLF